MTFKLFLDTADASEVLKAQHTGLIDGVTTNPTLIKKKGMEPYHVYKSMRSIGVPDISMEVPAGDYRDMLNSAMTLAQEFPEQATIKVPMTVDGLRVVRELTPLGIRSNVTLIFNAAQAIMAAKAGATYISPFVGRIDDQGYAGTEVVRSCAELLRGSSTKVLAASIRSTQRVVRCFYSGADIVTMPPFIFWKMYEHVLTNQGLEWFERDAS
tara:strand:- start:602 stop:1237 length:636 start_codon:yes stop_codon:yes gene_type:complete